MQYTKAQFEEIIAQLMTITVDGQQVFIVIPDESENRKQVFGLFVDSGPTTARLEFEKKA